MYVNKGYQFLEAESRCGVIWQGPELLNKYVGESERAVRQVGAGGGARASDRTPRWSGQTSRNCQIASSATTPPYLSILEGVCTRARSVLPARARQGRDRGVCVCARVCACACA